MFVDATKFLSNVPREEFPAQMLAIRALPGRRCQGVEIGALLADRDPKTRENRYPALEMVRLAIPRRVYTDKHMEVVAASLKNVFDRRDSIRSGLRILKEAPIMRHFTVELEMI